MKCTPSPESRNNFDFADAFIDYRVHDDGTIDGYDVSELNIDNVNAGKTLFELYDLTGKEKYRKAIDLIYSQIKLMPRTAEGSFWHKNIYPNQVWLDGLYMCQPFYMDMRHVLTIRRTMMIYSFSSRTS